MPARTTLRSAGFADPQESVRLCRWGFGLDGTQSAAAKSCQDWSSLLKIFSSTASDPVWSCPHWHHWRAASSFDPQPRGLHRRWHVHEDPRHSRRQSVLRGSTSYPERAAISVTTCGRLSWLPVSFLLHVKYPRSYRIVCLADLGSCTDCQQGGLLQLGSRWYPRSAARPTAVRFKCRRPFGFLSEAVRTHNPIALWTPLVGSSGASHIAAVRSGLPLSSWNSAGVLCWELLRTYNVALDVVCALLTQPCWWYRLPDVQQSMTVPPQWLRHVRRTACRRRSGMHRRWRRSVASWRLYFSGRRLTMTRRSWLYCTV